MSSSSACAAISRRVRFHSAQVALQPRLQRVEQKHAGHGAEAVDGERVEPVAPDLRVGVVDARQDAEADERAVARLEPVAHDAEHAEVHDEVAPERPGARAVEVRLALLVVGRGLEGERDVQLGSHAPGGGEVDDEHDVDDREHDLVERVERARHDVHDGTRDDVERAAAQNDGAGDVRAPPDEPEHDAVEHEVHVVEDVRVAHLVAVFDPEDRERQRERDVEREKDLDDPEEPELVRVGVISAHAHAFRPVRPRCAGALYPAHYTTPRPRAARGRC